MDNEHKNMRQCLIVEDHDELRKSLREWLGESLHDCEILEAATGEAGVGLAQAHQPALVLMDINLPTMSGIEATRRIKHTLPGTHVVMLTIHEDAAFQMDARAAGASAYVTKRKMHADLLPTLTRLLSPAPGGIGTRAKEQLP